MTTAMLCASQEWTPQGRWIDIQKKSILGREHQLAVRAEPALSVVSVVEHARHLESIGHFKEPTPKPPAAAASAAGPASAAAAPKPAAAAKPAAAKPSAAASASGKRALNVDDVAFAAPRKPKSSNYY
jgi:hypothetical protein